MTRSYARRGGKQYNPARRFSPSLGAKVYANKWSVRSHSDPSKFYTVSLTEDGNYECSCPAWIYQRGQKRDCKHIEQIKNSPLGALIKTSARTSGKGKSGQLQLPTAEEYFSFRQGK